MDPKRALAAFNNQKAGAKRRGIGWELTFHQWCEWWGEDISKRGVGHDKLSMQRVADAGPYALWNIRKGYPRDNAKTRKHVADRDRAKAGAELRTVNCMAAPHRIDHGDYDDVNYPEDERYIVNRLGKLRSCVALLDD